MFLQCLSHILTAESGLTKKHTQQYPFTWDWGADRLQRANYVSAGAQMNIQMVFFTHMKTTLSFGYARAWGNGINQGEFMFSLKLL